MSESGPAAVVVLAAGFGKRMHSATPKVLHPLGGRTLLGHVLAATVPLGAAETLVVVGHGSEQVREHLAAIAPAARSVLQAEQRGTGHAVATALAERLELAGTVLVVPGDAPLLTPRTLAALLAQHDRAGAATTLLTAVVADPTGYGRVVRGADGGVTAVVEEADADAAQRAITEVATSVYCFDATPLRAALARLGTDNAQGEQYLTDVVALQVADGRRVAALPAADAAETVGVNDRVQLAAAGRALRDRRLDELMRAGVTVLDPATTWVDVDVVVGPDAVLHPNTQLHGRTEVAAGALVGPNTTLTDTRVGPDARVVNTWAEGAEIGAQASVGPWTYLRPGTRLGERAKAGAYVEMKAATVGADSKVPHLSYVGDADIGERSNIGCGTVFVNYDGVAKHRSTVGDDVRVGSDSMLVAPVRIGDGAYTAAGSVVTEDVPPGALAVARARQRNVEGWVARRRAGTPAAEAARRAADGDASATGEETR